MNQNGQGSTRSIRDDLKSTVLGRCRQMSRENYWTLLSWECWKYKMLWRDIDTLQWQKEIWINLRFLLGIIDCSFRNCGSIMIRRKRTWSKGCNKFTGRNNVFMLWKVLMQWIWHNWETSYLLRFTRRI